MATCSVALANRGFPKIPMLVKGIFAYSLARNGYHLSQLPEKDTTWTKEGEHILFIDKVVAYPFICTWTIALLPFKVVYDLERVEHYIRKIPLPRSLELKNVSDVFMK